MVSGANHLLNSTVNRRAMLPSVNLRLHSIIRWTVSCRYPDLIQSHRAPD